MLDPARVTEVWDPAGRITGSGYLVDASTTLTAGHVVDDAVDGRCQVRPLGSRDWVDAQVVWRGEGDVDAAILRLDTALDGVEGRVRFGRLASDERAECRALGFPNAQAGEVRDTEELLGEIRPLTGEKSGLLTVHIVGSVPQPDDSGGSPWSGMSGAALFSGALLSGVIVVAPAHFGTDRLTAVPVSAFGDDLRRVLGEPDLAIAAVEDEDATRGVLRAPYQPLPEQAKARLAAGAIGFLLEPQYGVVPFRGREREMEELEHWCVSDATLSISLLTGAGGSGKTRLAAELCRHQEHAGATAGFLDSRVTDPERLAAVSTPLLVVVDEAQVRVQQVSRLIAALAASRRRARARVLLVARDQGDWWPDALAEELPDDPDVRFALDAAISPASELAAVDKAADARTAALRDAVEAFARRLGSQPSSWSPELSDPLFDSMFFLHLAALAVAAGVPPPPATRPIAEELLESALDREGRYWASSAKARGLSLSATERLRAVAVATMTTASTQAEAVAALAAVPELASEETARSVALWLRTLYPVPPAGASTGRAGGAPWFRPLAPDQLAEALVAKALAFEETASLPADLMSHAPGAEQVRRLLMILTRTSRSHPEVLPRLREALTAHLGSVWPVALATAQEVGDPLGRVVAEALETSADPALATAIADRLPSHTVTLRELRVAATRLALEHLEEGEDAIRQLFATNQAVFLRDLGRHEEALAAADEAVAICTDLVAARPGEFLLDLAMALNNQALSLGDLGRHEDGLTAIDKAVALFRELAAARPDDFLPGLARALNNQSNRLGDLGYREDALAAIGEAVAIRRELAATRPDDFMPPLAMSLYNQSIRFSELGRREEAHAAAEEAVALHREGAATRPDAFLPDLAMALHSQSVTLAALGRREDALAAIDEAVEIYSDLAAARPDVFQRDLERALERRSQVLSTLAGQIPPEGSL